MISNEQILNVLKNYEIHHACLGQFTISIYFEYNNYTIGYVANKNVVVMYIDINTDRSSDRIYNIDIGNDILLDVRYWIKKRATEWVQDQLKDIFHSQDKLDELIND